jgi:hypothetical protein
MALASCSDIDVDERLTVVNVVEVDTTASDTATVDTTDYFARMQRHVLVEDFTGQNCVNCPDATDLISQMQRKYGHNTVVAVAIHSGPLGVKPSKDPEGLATDLGDTYYNYWQIEMQPYGVIDRSDGPLSTDWWTAKINWDLSDEQPAPTVNIWVDALLSADNRADVVVTLAAHELTTGKMQLWVVEDSITAFQKMPDGNTNRNYTHNHVLRDAVNGTWGDEVTVTQGELKTFSYHFTPQAAWKPEHLAVVAFVYNDDGVVQVTRKELKIEK